MLAKTCSIMLYFSFLHCLLDD